MSYSAYMDPRDVKQPYGAWEEPRRSADRGYPPQQYDPPYDSQLAPRRHDYPPQRYDAPYDSQYPPQRYDAPYDPRYPPPRPDVAPYPPQGYQRPYDSQPPPDAYHLQAPPSYDSSYGRPPNMPPSPRPSSRGEYPVQPGYGPPPRGPPPRLPPRNTPSPNDSFQPVVVPQVTRVAMQGPNASPFTRAYAPSLRARNVSMREFLAFVDGLNEAFLATPPARAAGTVGNLLGFVPLASAQIAGTAIQLGSGLAGAAISFVRARNFVAAANEQTWHPRGLHARVVKTPKMCAALGVPGGALHAATGEERGGDLREERMRALRGYAAPLDYNVPAPAQQDDWFKKMGNWAAERTGKQQEEKSRKKRDKANEKIEKDRAKGKDTSGESKKMQKVVRKEEKNLNGIYWIVITTNVGIADGDEGDLNERDEQEQRVQHQQQQQYGDEHSGGGDYYQHGGRY